MTKFVRDTKAGKAISAYVVFNLMKEHVATIQARYSESGALTLNLFHTDGETPVQTATARGYGYDKLAHALEGLTIDGVTMGAQGLNEFGKYGFRVIQAI